MREVGMRKTHSFASIMICLLVASLRSSAQPSPQATATPEQRMERKAAAEKQAEPEEADAEKEKARKEPVRRRQIVPEEEISYKELARRAGTTVKALNKLNGLNLDAWTLLARGSELYVPVRDPST